MNQLADLRGTGDTMKDADAIIMCYRPPFPQGYTPNKPVAKIIEERNGVASFTIYPSSKKNHIVIEYWTPPMKKRKTKVKHFGSAIPYVKEYYAKFKAYTPNDGPQKPVHIKLKEMISCCSSVSGLMEKPNFNVDCANIPFKEGGIMNCMSPFKGEPILTIDSEKELDKMGKLFGILSGVENSDPVEIESVELSVEDNYNIYEELGKVSKKMLEVVKLFEERTDAAKERGAPFSPLGVWSNIRTDFSLSATEYMHNKTKGLIWNMHGIPKPRTAIVGDGGKGLAFEAAKLALKESMQGIVHVPVLKNRKGNDNGYGQMMFNYEDKGNIDFSKSITQMVIEQGEKQAACLADDQFKSSRDKEDSEDDFYNEVNEINTEQFDKLTTRKYDSKGVEELNSEQLIVYINENGLEDMTLREFAILHGYNL